MSFFVTGKMLAISGAIEMSCLSQADVWYWKQTTPLCVPTTCSESEAQDQLFYVVIKMMEEMIQKVDPSRPIGEFGDCQGEWKEPTKSLRGYSVE